METQKKNVFLLACCQALLLTNAVTLISIGALAGYALAEDKRLATLPQAAYVVGALIGTLPASLWMRRVGRRNGFLTGGIFALAGSTVATYAMVASSLMGLCAGTLLLGIYNAFGQYYRFAAADAAAKDLAGARSNPTSPLSDTSPAALVSSSAWQQASRKTLR
jgi:MFS family permease